MKKIIKIKKNAGMTYVELIVVLGIFAVLSTVVIFNYGDFQAKVDIKNLASDIALKIVEAQKASLNGLLPSGYTPIPDWKPAYGVYFSTTTTALSKQFIYFADLDNNGIYNESAIDTISITKNNYIFSLNVYPGGGTINDLTITFARPDSGAKIYFNNALQLGISYVQITIKSPKGATALIKLYPSGRVQVN